MKEDYLSESWIEAQVQKYCTQKTRKQELWNRINFSNTALMVIDMQDYFLHKDSHAFIPSAQKAIEVSNSLISFFDKNKRPIIFTKHFDSPITKPLMKHWWRGNITESSELSQQLTVPNTTDIFLKSSYNAFENQDILAQLESNKIESIVFTGVMTHLCVETSIRIAFTLNYLPLLALDATASYNSQHHENSLYNLSHGFALIDSSKNIIKYLGEHYD